LQSSRIKTVSDFGFVVMDISYANKKVLFRFF
jgi:hypothetical protein